MTGETKAAPSRNHDDEQLDDLQRRLDELVLERAHERRDLARVEPCGAAAQTRGDWLQTFTMRQVYPLDLRPEDVAVEDIAHALSLQCRFAGHTRGLYSVGQHSLLVADYLERRGESPEVVLWGLLHDASEAYLSDIPRPLKRRPEFAFYREAEARAMRAICARFGMAPGEPSAVKHADGVLLATEARDLMAPLHPDWHHQEANGFEVLPQSISPRWWAEVERDFLARFDGLLSALDAHLLASMGRTVTSRARGAAMNRSDREGVRRARLDTRTDVVADGAVLWYGFDVLNRGVWSIVGAHESVMAHLRERAPLPGGAR